MLLIDSADLKLFPPVGENNIVTYVRGKLSYYHYLCDDVDDKGWGCGYRSLQTVCSWICNQEAASNKLFKVPSIVEIQRLMVQLQDKEPTFIGSRDWIGSVESSMCIGSLYSELCKIIHFASSQEIQDFQSNILQEFSKFGSPVLIGGDRDTTAKTAIGFAINRLDSQLLILDHHNTKKDLSLEALYSKGWLKWVPISSFDRDSFYNFCFVQKIGRDL